VSDPIVTTGVLGWGNRKSGLEAYGPGGRWAGRVELPPRPATNAGLGDLLGDHLDEQGASEGADLVVVALPRRCGVDPTAALAAILRVVDDLKADAAEAKP
jgi:hypothetical protein